MWNPVQSRLEKFNLMQNISSNATELMQGNVQIVTHLPLRSRAFKMSSQSLSNSGSRSADMKAYAESFRAHARWRIARSNNADSHRQVTWIYLYPSHIKQSRYRFLLSFFPHENCKTIDHTLWYKYALQWTWKGIKFLWDLTLTFDLESCFCTSFDNTIAY